MIVCQGLGPLKIKYHFQPLFLLSNATHIQPPGQSYVSRPGNLKRGGFGVGSLLPLSQELQDTSPVDREQVLAAGSEEGGEPRREETRPA